MRDFAAGARLLSPQMTAWRRALHQIPEVGNHLPQTRNFLVRELEAMGLVCRLFPDCSGIEAVIEGDLPGETIALRADIDALPIQEQTGLPYASVHDGAMHACGHDAHAAMLLGAARLLLERKEQLRGRVVCLFQAGEEGAGGAELMLAQGALENPKPRAVLGMHITPSLPELGPGQIGLRDGPLMASADSFEILLTGRGGHIAAPETARNPLPAAAEIVLALAGLDGDADREREVIGIAAVHTGTEAFNVIPETVRLRGSFRARSEGARRGLRANLEQVCARAAQKAHLSWEIDFPEGIDVLVNSEALTGLVRRCSSVLFPDDTVELSTPIMASDDFSVLARAVGSGCYIHLGCGRPGGQDAPLHNARFDPDESVFWRGAALLAAGAAQWLRENSPAEDSPSAGKREGG